MNPGAERRGIAYGIAAYGMWGLFPLYFALLRFAGPVEVVAHRVLWALLVCLITLAVRRELGTLAALRDRRTTARLTLAALLLSTNWCFYIYSVAINEVTQASLGYFINPLVTVVLGVLVLRERLRPAQWVAVGIGALAVVVLTVDYGRPPWIALTLAATFGGYGLLKKQVGVTLGALPGLTAETAVLAPLAAGYLVWLQATGGGHLSLDAPDHLALLALAGPITVVPLLCFAAAARRAPLSTIGLLQYLTPVLQLLCAVLLLGEHMPLSRWIGFALVWVALAVFSADSLRAVRSRDRRAVRRGPVPV